MAKPFEDLRFPHELSPLEDVEWDYSKMRDKLRTRGELSDYDYGISAQIYDQMPALAARAQQAAKEAAVSYRGFLVGAAIYVTDSENWRSGIFYGANIKPGPDAPKRCAEREAIAKARVCGYTKVNAIAVSGPLQPDAVSGLVSDTLHPCGDCRHKFREDPLIFPDTQILTVDTEGNAHELYTMVELFRLHGVDFFDDRPTEEERYLRLVSSLIQKAS